MGDIEGTMDPNFIKDPDQPICKENPSSYCYYDPSNPPFAVECVQTWIDTNECCSDYSETIVGTYSPNWALTADSFKAQLKACTWQIVDVEYYDPAGICSFTNSGTLYGLNDCSDCSCESLGYFSSASSCDPKTQPNLIGHSFKAGESCGNHPVSNQIRYWQADAICYECY